MGGQISTDGAFLSGGNLFYLGLDIGEIALIALPLTLVIVAGEIDLSVASVLGLSSALIGWLWNAGWPLETILPAVIVVGRGVRRGQRPARSPGSGCRRSRSPSARSRSTAGSRWWCWATRRSRTSRRASRRSARRRCPAPTSRTRSCSPWSWRCCSAIALHASSFGRSLYAIGANEEGARFSGIRVKRIKLILFVLAGAVAAIAGIVCTFRFSSARADNGVGLELAVVAAVLLGGVSIFGGRGRSSACSRACCCSAACATC